jgi:hypothetical protein
MDNGTLVILVVLGVFLILGIIVFTRYRKAEGTVKLPGGAEVTVKGDNSAPQEKPAPAPAPPPAGKIEVNGATARTGDINITGTDNVKASNLDAGGSIDVTQGQPPKA